MNDYQNQEMRILIREMIKVLKEIRDAIRGNKDDGK